LPLSNIALRSPHQRGDRQAVVGGQLPAHRQPFPVLRQHRRSRRGTQSSRDVGAQPGPRRDRSHTRSYRTGSLIGGHVERMNLEVIYGDTDSIMVNSNSIDFEEVSTALF